MLFFALLALAIAAPLDTASTPVETIIAPAAAVTEECCQTAAPTQDIQEPAAVVATIEVPVTLASVPEAVPTLESAVAVSEPTSIESQDTFTDPSPVTSSTAVLPEVTLTESKTPKPTANAKQNRRKPLVTTTEKRPSTTTVVSFIVPTQDPAPFDDVSNVPAISSVASSEVGSREEVPPPACVPEKASSYSDQPAHCDLSKIPTDLAPKASSLSVAQLNLRNQAPIGPGTTSGAPGLLVGVGGGGGSSGSSSSSSKSSG